MTGQTKPQASVDLYQCPVSGSPLHWTEGRVVTSDGVRSYEIDDGCPVFLARPNTEVSTELDTVRRALTLSRSLGWRSAIDEAYVKGTGGHTYITEEGRVGFLDLLPLSDKSVVLEIGCSMGQHTPLIASRCAAVYGLDVIREQAQFTQERCRQQGFLNVSVACGGDDARLPYRDGAFDIVVMNLVLEWCASRSPEPHDAIHRRLLREIARVTKPGGMAFLTTKNRYSLKLLLGGRDEHAHQLRFGSALPRSMLDGIIKRRGLARAPGWLHSYRELRDMVTEAGFSEASTFWAAPEMRYPVRYVPTDSASVRAARRGLGRDIGPSRAYRMLFPHLPAALIKYVSPGLSFVAVRSRRGGPTGS